MAGGLGFLISFLVTEVGSREIPFLGPRHGFIASRHGELKFATHVFGLNAVKR